jgi:hypothetical protein
LVVQHDGDLATLLDQDAPALGFLDKVGSRPARAQAT